MYRTHSGLRLTCVQFVTMTTKRCVVFWQNESATAKELVKIIEDDENEYQVRGCEREASSPSGFSCFHGFLTVRKYLIQWYIETQLLGFKLQ